MTVNHDVAGSNPASGASGLFVKRLRHRPFTAGSGVRIPHRSPWAISSAGRASALQAECQQFDPVIAHQKKASCASRRDAFFLPFPSRLIYHLTSCIRAHDHLRVALLLQMMFAAEPVRSCFRPPKRRPHVICSMGSFFLPFSFFLYSHITSCIRDSLHFVRRFAPSKCVRCGTSSILLSPTIMKSSTCSAPWDFLLPFLLRSG